MLDLFCCRELKPLEPLVIQMGPHRFGIDLLVATHAGHDVLPLLVAQQNGLDHFLDENVSLLRRFLNRERGGFVRQQFVGNSLGLEDFDDPRTRRFC